MDGKDLPVIKTIYWEQTAAMGVDGEISSLKKKYSVGCQAWTCAFARFFSLSKVK